MTLTADCQVTERWLLHPTGMTSIWISSTTMSNPRGCLVSPITGITVYLHCRTCCCQSIYFNLFFCRVLLLPFSLEWYRLSTYINRRHLPSTYQAFGNFVCRLRRVEHTTGRSTAPFTSGSPFPEQQYRASYCTWTGNTFPGSLAYPLPIHSPLSVCLFRVETQCDSWLILVRIASNW